MSPSSAIFTVLKAEVSYSRVALLVSYGIILAFLGAGVRAEWSAYNIVINTAIVYFISVGAMGSEADKEKRDRLYVLLPLPFNQINLARLLFVVLYQLSLFVLWIVFFTIRGAEFEAWPIGISAVNAGVLFVLSLFIVYHDLGYFHNDTYRRIFFGVLFGIVAAVVLSLIDLGGQLVVFYKRLFLSWPFVLGLNLLWLVLFYYCFALFARRKSYLS